MLHGPQPGLIEISGEHNVAPQAVNWLREAAAGFAGERHYLTQLIVAVGPAPSTPGEAETASVILDQRRALEMIACSERFGCALGAVVGLVFDWEAMRSVLDVAALRLGISPASWMLPSEEATGMMLESLPDYPRLDRALCFGGRQLLAQHRGLWDVLEARAAAREGR
jgi:hypothetical protein